jgi:L-iditol 2-dehydrogenase
VRFGADIAVTPEQAHDGALDDVVGSGGADVSVEIAGTDDAIAIAMLAAAPGGRVVLAGIPDADRSAFPASLARRKGLTILMSRRMNATYPRTIALVRRQAVDVESIVTDRFEIAQIAEAFAVAAGRTGLKTVVEVRRP